LHGKHRAPDIDGEGLVEVRGVQVLQRRERPTTGIGEQDVQAATALSDLRVDRIEIVQVGHVASDADHSMTDRSDRLIELGLAAAGGKHVGALHGEALGCREADPGRAAGHEGCLACKLIHRCPPPHTLHDTSRISFGWIAIFRLPRRWLRMSKRADDG
jgi:hypothetical protein